MLLLLVIVLALSLRIYALDSQSFWNDELDTYDIIVKPTSAIVFSQEVRNFPPLYFLVVKALLPYHPREFYLRLPSVVFGVFSVLVFFFILNNWWNEKIALLGSFVMALSPFHIWYSQEARPYAMLIFFSLLAVLFLQQFLKKPDSVVALVSLAIASTLTFYIHYIAIAFIGAILLAVLLFQKNKSVGFRLAFCAVVVALLVPGFYRILTVSPDATASSFYSLKPASIAYVVWSFFTGYSLGPSLSELHYPHRMKIVLSYWPIIVPVMLVLSIGTVLGIWRLLRANSTLFALVGLWFLLPLLFAVLGSLLSNHPFNIRYSVLSFPALLVMLIVGVYHPRSGWLTASATLVIGFILTISVANYFFLEKYQRDNNRAAGAFLTQFAESHDLVIASAAYTARNIRYYYRGNSSIHVEGFPSSAKNQYGGSEHSGSTFVEEKTVGQELLEITRGKNRFWLFLSRTFHSDPNGLIRKFLDKNFIVQKDVSWNGVELILYSSP